MSEAALQQLEIATKRIKGAPTFREGGVAAENKFKEAYQACVRAGVKSQIRAKYRQSAMAKKVGK